MAKNDYSFVDEIAQGYEKSQTNQSMLSEYIRLVTDRQKLTSEIKKIQVNNTILSNITQNF